MKSYDECFKEYLEAKIKLETGTSLAETLKEHENAFAECRVAFKPQREAVQDSLVTLVLHPKTEALTVVICGEFYGKESSLVVDQKLENWFWPLYKGVRMDNKFMGHCHPSIVDEIRIYLEEEFPGFSFYTRDARTVVYRDPSCLRMALIPSEDDHRAEIKEELEKFGPKDREGNLSLKGPMDLKEAAANLWIGLKKAIVALETVKIEDLLNGHDEMVSDAKELVEVTTWVARKPQEESLGDKVLPTSSADLRRVASSLHCRLDTYMYSFESELPDHVRRENEKLIAELRDILNETAWVDTYCRFI